MVITNGAERSEPIDRTPHTNQDLLEKFPAAESRPLRPARSDGYSLRDRSLAVLDLAEPCPARRFIDGGRARSTNVADVSKVDTPWDGPRVQRPGWSTSGVGPLSWGALPPVLLRYLPEGRRAL